jgi:NTP pyrophosphatase (non-canonical NTP hydrolase)
MEGSASVDLRTAQKRVAENKIDKGFNRDVPTEICLMQGEVAEFFDAWRRDRPDAGEELADVVIYALGLAEILDIDLQAEVVNKIEKNSRRRYEPGPNGTLVKSDEARDGTC